MELAQEILNKKVEQEKNLALILKHLDKQGSEVYNLFTTRFLQSGSIVVAYTTNRNKHYLGTFKVIGDKVIEINRRNT